jgi:hypothetical protein
MLPWQNGRNVGTLSFSISTMNTRPNTTRFKEYKITQDINFSTIYY